MIVFQTIKGNDVYSSPTSDRMVCVTYVHENNLHHLTEVVALSHYSRLLDPQCERRASVFYFYCLMSSAFPPLSVVWVHRLLV